MKIRLKLSWPQADAHRELIARIAPDARLAAQGHPDDVVTVDWKVSVEVNGLDAAVLIAKLAASAGAPLQVQGLDEVYRARAAVEALILAFGRARVFVPLALDREVEL